MCSKLSFSLGIILSIFFLAGTWGCNGYEGKVYERNQDGSIGQIIPDVEITFIREDGSLFKKETSDENGFYHITLDVGRYLVTATHMDYEDYSSVPGFFVVSGDGYQTGNIFLRKPRVTTVLLVRHAEKSTTPPDDPILTPEGDARARKLLHVAQKAGVTAIFATTLQRTQLTVQYVADFLKIDPIIIDNNDQLVNTILSDYAGDVILVAGHSNTLPQIARLLGADFPTDIQYLDDYDNLLMVTKKTDNDLTNCINLQYGNLSLPDKGRGQNTTIKIRSGTFEGDVLATLNTLVPAPVSTGAKPVAHFPFLLPINLTTGENYIIEWVSSDDRILTWMAAEGNPYDRGTVFGCTGVPIVDEDFVFKTYHQREPLQSDQINDATATKSRGCGMPSMGNLFQSFIPSVSSLAGIDLQLRAGGNFLHDVSYAMTTIMLINNAETGEEGSLRAEKLVQILLKAGISAIYANPTQQTVQRLADLYGQQVSLYDSGDIPAFVNPILVEHSGKAIVIAGNKDTLSEIIQVLGGYPTPVIYQNEHDNLLILTVTSEGEAKVINLQYGTESPTG